MDALLVFLGPVRHLQQEDGALEAIPLFDNCLLIFYSGAGLVLGFES